MSRSLDLEQLHLLQRSQALQVIVSLVAGPNAPEKVLQALDCCLQVDPKSDNSPAASKLHSTLEEVGWLLQILAKQEGLLLRIILTIAVAVALRRLLHAASVHTQPGSNFVQARQLQSQPSQQHTKQQHSLLQAPQLHDGGHILAAVPAVRYKDVRIFKPLAEGGYATVYAAYWNRQALVLKKHKEGNIKQLMKEAEMMEQSRHSHVVQLLGVCHDPPALLMQWCQGGSLAAPVQEFRHAADAATACQLLHDVAAAVCCFHSEASRVPPRALVHLDLRASNVLLGSRVGPQWDVKVTDFGLAEWLNPSGTAVVNRTTNHLWVAPEVLHPFATFMKQGEGNTMPPLTVSRASEVWMFGMLMLEVLTGQTPYAEQLGRLHVGAQRSMMGVWSPCHEFGRAPFPQQLKYQVPDSQWQQLQQVYDACTAMRPEDRPCMHEVHDQLSRLCRQLQQQQEQQHSLSEVLSRDVPSPQFLTPKPLDAAVPAQVAAPDSPPASVRPGGLGSSCSGRSPVVGRPHAGSVLGMAGSIDLGPFGQVMTRPISQASQPSKVAAS